jgi:hypothetical protein
MRQVLDRLDHTGRDPSAFSLIVANLITIELALLGRWELGQVMRIYWWQSVIIGAFHFVRLLRLEHFHTEGPDESGEVIAPTADEKLRSAAAFILSFGWMHAIYMMFILRLPVERPDYPYLMPVAVVAVGGNHHISLLKNVESEVAEPPGDGAVGPLARPADARGGDARAPVPADAVRGRDLPRAQDDRRPDHARPGTSDACGSGAAPVRRRPHGRVRLP